MSETVSFDEFHSVFNKFFEEINLPCESIGYVDYVTLPARMGEGKIQRIKLRQGMEILIAEYQFTNHSKAVYRMHPFSIREQEYFLAGIGDIDVPGTRFVLSDDLCHLAFLQPVEGGDELSKDGSMLFIEISMAGPIYKNFLEQESSDTLSKVTNLIQSGPLLVIKQGISFSSKLIINEMMKLWKGHTMGRMYLESKSIELMAMHLHENLFGKTIEAKSTIWRKQDLDKIKRAKEILIEQMDNPPSLLELSSIVGMNDFKLKLGFKELLGTTVFGFLRDKRMEKARFLLEQNYLNVNEVACTVGYANPSHFARAFREKYGINPREVKNILESIQV